MAEIKSTLELALERTKKLSITEKEREEIREGELLKKASGLSTRYREGHVPLHALTREVERMDPTVAAKVKERLTSEWIDALSLEGENQRLLEGIASLKGRDARALEEKLTDLSSGYRQKQEHLRQQVERDLAEALKMDGIHGGAVVPKVEGSPAWQEAMEAMNETFAPRLAELKTALRCL